MERWQKRAAMSRKIVLAYENTRFSLDDDAKEALEDFLKYLSDETLRKVVADEFVTQKEKR